jgi:hypothetical protein
VKHWKPHGSSKFKPSGSSKFSAPVKAGKVL